LRSERGPALPTPVNGHGGTATTAHPHAITDNKLISVPIRSVMWVPRWFGWSLASSISSDGRFVAFHVFTYAH